MVTVPVSNLMLSQRDIERHQELALHKDFNFLAESFNSQADYELSPLDVAVRDLLTEAQNHDEVDARIRLLDTQFKLPTAVPTKPPVMIGWNYYFAPLDEWRQGSPDMNELHILDFEASRLFYTGGIKGVSNSEVINEFDTDSSDEDSSDEDDPELERHIGQWSALCAVAISPDGTIYAWVPPNEFDVHYAECPPFVAFNAAYDLRWTSNHPINICVQMLAKMLFKGTDSQTNAKVANPSVPWGAVTLPPRVSLLAVADHLRIPHDHSKDTRDLTIKHLWATNRAEHLSEILLYCIEDVILTLKVWNKLAPYVKQISPSSATWNGLFEISQYRLPISKDFHSWVKKVYTQIDVSNRDWADKLAGHLRSQYPLHFQAVSFLMAELEHMTATVRPLSFWLTRSILVSHKQNPKIRSAHKKNCVLLANLMAPKNLYALLKTSLEEESTHNYPWLDWGINGTNGFEGPTWVKKTKLQYSSKILWVAMNAFNGDSRLVFDGKRYPNLFKKNGDPSGSAWSKHVEDGQLTCPWTEFGTFREYARQIHAMTALRKRLTLLQIHEKDGWYWYYPDLDRHGTISGRLTDSIILVGLQYNPGIPGSELLALFECPEGLWVLWSDWTGQESMLFGAYCDAVYGKLGYSEYAKINLTADMHTVIRDLLRFEKTKQGRQAAKNYTFLLQYGGGLAGCVRYLKTAGYSEEDAYIIGTGLINGYVGRCTGKGSSKRYSGGIASDGYNFLQSWIYNEKPRTPILKRAIPIPLRPRYQTGKDELTLKNLPCQGGGVDQLHLIHSEVWRLASFLGAKYQPLMSIHDRPGWLFAEECFDTSTQIVLPSGTALPSGISKAEVIVQAAHLIAVAELYGSLRIDALPKKYAYFDGLDIDNRMRQYPTQTYETASTPGGFPIMPYNQVDIPAEGA